MSRRKAAPKRKVLPDPLFGSEVVANFINVVMKDGKKAVAEKIVYGAFEKVVASQRAKEDAKADDGIRTNEGLRKLALELFDKVVVAVRPLVEVRSRRVGGATYQIPVDVSAARGVALAMRWLVIYANKRSEKNMASRLAGEMLDILAGKGGALKKREDVHKMAEANKAFAHFRW